MHAFKATVGARFKIKYLSDLSQLLGMHITRNRSARTMSMDQSKYVKDIMFKHNMSNCKPSSLPMEPGFLSGLAHIDSPLLTGLAKDVYPSLLGSLQYAAVCTRPEVSTTLSILGYAQANLTEAHLQIGVRYLKGTLELRLTLGGGGAKTSPNSPASLMQTRRMTVDNASHDPVTWLPWEYVPLATSQSSKNVSRCPRVKLGITQQQTPPRRAYTSANSWGRSSTSPSTEQLPFGKITTARLHTHRTHWLAR
jgi:hypothetical protein